MSTPQHIAQCCLMGDKLSFNLSTFSVLLPQEESVQRPSFRFIKLIGLKRLAEIVKPSDNLQSPDHPFSEPEM